MLLALLENLTKVAGESLPGVANPSRYGVKQMTSSGGFKKPKMTGSKPRGLTAPKLKLSNSPAKTVSLDRTLSQSRQLATTGRTRGVSLPSISMPKLAGLRRAMLRHKLQKEANWFAPVAVAGTVATGAWGVGTLRSPLGAASATGTALRPRKPPVHGAGMRNLARDPSGATGFYGMHHTRKGSRVNREQSLLR